MGLYFIRLILHLLQTSKRSGYLSSICHIESILKINTKSAKNKKKEKEILTGQ
jgi:hypothetical protein